MQSLSKLCIPQHKKKAETAYMVICIVNTFTANLKRYVNYLPAIAQIEIKVAKPNSQENTINLKRIHIKVKPKEHELKYL